MVIPAANGDQDLPNSDAGASPLRLSESSAHTGLKSISPGTRQHLVDTQHVKWVHADTHVEQIFTSVLDHILVRCHTSGLQRLR